jgi:hypothetical protein
MSIMLIFIILVMIYNSNNENLTGTSTSVLSNESVQNMATLLNTGQGTIQNLKITGTLQVGNINLVSNTDGSVSFGGSKLLQDGSIQFGSSKLTPDGNIITGNQIINANGTITNPILKWTNGTKWQMAPEGDVMIIRNSGAAQDSRFAIFPNVFTDISTNISSPGNISGNTLSIPNYLISNYGPCGGQSFGITDSARNRTYSFWDNHLRTVTPGGCSDNSRMNL